MPHKGRVQGQPVVTVTGIPLYLIPRVVADQIHTVGESVFQITVTRSNLHYYTVVVTTTDYRQNQTTKPHDENESRRNDTYNPESVSSKSTQLETG